MSIFFHVMFSRTGASVADVTSKLSAAALKDVSNRQFGGFFFHKE